MATDEDYVDILGGDSEDSLTLPSSTSQDNFDTLYDQWVEQASAKHVFPDLTIPDALRMLYPGYSLIMSGDSRLDLLSFPRVHVERIPLAQEVTDIMFDSIRRGVGGTPSGRLMDRVIYGSYKMTSQGREFIVFIIKVPQGTFFKIVHFILHEGDEGPARDLMLSAMLFHEELHNEIWVYDQGVWSKDKNMWSEVENASWEDIIMKEDYKQGLRNDISGFFRSEEIYKKLAIPWKRGLIMYGAPGNGKTITVKAIIRTCAERGFTPLYVKSFRNFRGDEVAMQDVFQKARQTSPCVLILEDLDSLVNDSNRSYFLNQLDGLEGNSGLLVIASTNHFERLDPALSSRPSRFDRKYLFDDPHQAERALFAKYWQTKLQSNADIDFPDSLVEEVACATAGFSFAYLKEAFVSALVQLTTAGENVEINFADTLRQHISGLKKEIGKPQAAVFTASSQAKVGNTKNAAKTPTVLSERDMPASLLFGSEKLHPNPSTDPLSSARYVAERVCGPDTAGNPRDTVNSVASPDPDAKASTVLRIRFGESVEPARRRLSQTTDVFPAPLAAYPQAIRPISGALPGRSTESWAPRQL